MKVNRIAAIGAITEASNAGSINSQVFHTDDGGNRTEKLRITSGGDVLVGGQTEYTYDDTGPLM